MRIRQGAWGVAAVAVVGLAVAGCTGPTTHGASPSASDRATFETSTTPSPTAAPTSTGEAEPVPTPDMAKPSADGALAAAKYYMDLYGYAFATGDLTTWRAMSADDCRFCNSVIEDVESMVAQKHTSPGASIEFSTANGTEVVPQQSYGVDVIAIQGPWTELDSAGAVVDSGGSSTVQMYFALGWGENGWLVRQVDVHDAPTS